jgi:predicted O-methyltransferase YrrM
MGKPANVATYRKAIVDLASKHKPRVIVEVGVASAGLSRMLLSVPGVERLVLVDLWPGHWCDYGQEHMDKVAAEVFAWAAGEPRVEVLRLHTAMAAECFHDGTVDFFHTDSDHSLEGIRADIKAWLPKVRNGGILSGDNYEIPTVAQGVNEALPHKELLANGRVWWAFKEG